MNIVIIGWYGTETIGDRAILAGIVFLFSKVIDQFNIQIGSLYPDFTKRTLLEDNAFYKDITGFKLNDILVFNSLNKRELKKKISQSDLVIIGGGPLMDIEQMYMLDYAFKYAKSRKIKTCVLGCGWGPLKTTEFKKVAQSIIKHADLTIFRDCDSLKQYTELSGINKNEKIYSSIDPAFFCAFIFKRKHFQQTKKYIAVNFRDISLDLYDGDANKNEDFFIQILSELSKIGLPIHLVPMHTYHIGGDDRALLNKLSFRLNDCDIIVHNDPLTLEEVMTLYQDATLCIGMRFHSVVLQTVLNGKNIILDYTDPEKGKIISMMKELDIISDYKNKYMSLLGESDVKLEVSLQIPEYSINNEFIYEKESIYTSNLKKLLK